MIATVMTSTRSTGSEISRASPARICVKGPGRSAPAGVPPPDTTPPDTTPPDTTPPDTTPTTTTTVPPDTTPTTTTTVPSDTTTTTTTPEATPDTTTPSTTTDAERDDPPNKPAVRDTDIYVGSVSTLSAGQRDAIDAFLAATARLAHAHTLRAGIEAASTMNEAAPSKSDLPADLARAAPPKLALLDSAIAVNRAVNRVAFYAQEAFGARASETADAAERAEAQAAVDAAQTDLDRAADDLRAVAGGDPLITALLTGKPPAGDRLAQEIVAAQAGQGNPPRLTELFDVPIANAPLVSRYGFRIDPISGNVGFHPGIDISAPQGTPIRASAAGTVVVAGSQGGYGNAVILDHGDSLSTLYGHMVSVGVKPGQQVAAGDVIGFVGSTGISTGPHVHFEVRVHGVTVDPLPTLKT